MRQAGIALLGLLLGGISPGLAAEQPITLKVDASEIARNIVRSRLTIPAKPGPLTLYYPKWIPGNHAPTGPIADLAGLEIKAGKQVLAWQRNEEDPYVLHCEVPAGAGSVEVSFDLLGSATPGSSSTTGTARLAVINWNQVLLYPKTEKPLKLLLAPHLHLPKGWKAGSALKPIPGGEGAEPDHFTYAPVTLETLIDSPVLCGLYFREIPLGPKDGPNHFLVLACDSEDGLELRAEDKACYDRLITETHALFGNHRYGSYRFLLGLSDRFRFSGLEHHESSDNRLPERALLDAKLRKLTAGLLPHEFVHSWNGKNRRPADMITPDFQQAQRTRLLWVYEGLTHYLMVVLTARCGLWTPEDTRESLAALADEMSNHRGRAWRPLEDTTVASSLLRSASPGWTAWRRSADYYDEGVLLWLEVDTLIRTQSQGKKSLDDFCRLFFGGSSGPAEVKAYTFDDLVAALNEVAPYDWKAHLLRRVTTVAEQAPLEGLIASGWKLGYQNKPSDSPFGRSSLRKEIDLSGTIGLRLGQEGNVTDVIPGKPADKAGIGPGMKVVAVNGRRWSAERLVAAVGATRTGSKVELLMENGDFFRSHTLDYGEGLKYARLERLSSRPDLLTEILKPRTPQK